MPHSKFQIRRDTVSPRTPVPWISKHLLIQAKSASTPLPQSVNLTVGLAALGLSAPVRAKVDRRHTQTIACLPLTSLAALVIMRINICLKYERVRMCECVWVCARVNMWFWNAAGALERVQVRTGLVWLAASRINGFWLGQLTIETQTHARAVRSSAAQQLSSSTIHCAMWIYLFVICNPYNSAGVRLTRTVTLWLCYEIVPPL